MGLTVFIHSSVFASLQSTCSALVSVGFVDKTRFPGLAGVLSVPADGSFEETGTSVASENVVMFAR